MKLYNSLTKKEDFFVPRERKTVRMYVCGITPYDTTHIGHAFTYVFFDTLVRYLKYKGYKVIYTQNVTDIDDDLLKRAKEVGQNWKDLGDYWTDRYLSDMRHLNVSPPTYYVRATDSIPKIIEINQMLEELDFAYEREGNVYFDVEKFKDYGKLSKYDKAKMKVLLAERGGDPQDQCKKHPLDFILWQKAKEDEPWWDSPWGKGRPGWHIECSAMIHNTLGEQIDIHGGGFDLIYPHHESEIAQSESYTAKIPFVKYWLHTAMVKYKGKKMSKSLGNLVLVSDLLKKYSANAIRWYLLSHHYTYEWEFSYDELSEAEEQFKIFYKALHLKPRGSYERQFNSALENNLDIPAALKIVRDNISNLQNKLEEYLLMLGFSV